MTKLRRPAAEELREGLAKEGFDGPNVDKICAQFGAIIDRLWVDFEEKLAEIEKALDDHREWGP